MHPLCCIAPLRLDGDTSPLSGSGDSEVQSAAADAADVLQHRGCPKDPSVLWTRQLDPSVPFPTARTFKQLLPADDAYLDGHRSPVHAHAPTGRSRNVITPDPSFRLQCFSGELTEVREKESKSVCPAGSSFAGILYKWVNYGKGWRPRWFVLREGVLSYYKVRGHDKIVVNRETQKGFKVIGDSSQRLIRKGRNLNTEYTPPRKTFGELHLKVSSIRNSKSDDKKFYIFTGTKTLHLRAETREDRVSWLDALHAAKDLFPKGPLLTDIVLPFEEIHVSTEKLRNRLLQENLHEDAISECERIVLSEFAELQDQLKFMQRTGISLIERLRQLEAEKVELETTLVDQSQNYALDEDASKGPEMEKEEGSGTESDEYLVKHDGVDADSEEDDDAFFDTREFLSRSYCRQSLSDSDLDVVSVGSSSKNTCVADCGIKYFDFCYPYVQRRKHLPEPKEKEKGVSLWSLIKDNIGKDLTRICLPVYFNEPLSSLQKCFEDLEYSHLLDQAYEWGRRGDSLLRALNVAAFAISGYSSTDGRICKPFNPLLGETYEADYSDKGLRFFSEKVSHHPMIVACHCDGRGWKFWGDSTVKSKFWGRSIQLDPVGILTLQFDDGETFQWSKVTTSIYNLILGKLYCDHYGTMRIQGNHDLSCRIKFKEQSIIDRNPHQVQGFVHDKSGKKLATLLGKWDESVHFVKGDVNTHPKGYDPMSEATLLWKRNRPAECATRYNLTSFAITLNELTPGMKEKLPPTDSRLRPDQRHLERGEYDLGFAEKLRLEQKQRQARKLQERGWQPRWFNKEKGTDTYKYVGGYWEAREQRNWSGCPDIFGPGLPELAQE